MTKVNQDIPTGSDERFVAGDTARLNVTVTTADDSPKDLSQSTVAFNLARYAGATAIISKDSSGSDVEIVDAANGEIQIELQPSDTADLGDAGGTTYYYDIEVEDDSGDVSTVTVGLWTIFANTGETA